MKLNLIIKKPLITEKSTIFKDKNNQYIFEVNKKANKIEIANAIQMIFNVKVLSVRTMNIIGKKKRIGKIIGQKNNWKKAIIKIAKEQKIEIFENI